MELKTVALGLPEGSEASGPCLIRTAGNDPILQAVATLNAQAIALLALG
jgi:adenosine/AMP kinase